MTVLRGNFSIFFFSSRRRHTRLQGDWSSDVCSSDLSTVRITAPQIGIWGAVILTVLRFIQGIGVGGEWGGSVLMSMEWRSEERRVGEEGRFRWSPYH